MNPGRPHRIGTSAWIRFLVNAVLVSSSAAWGTENSSEDAALNLADGTPEIALPEPSRWKILSEAAIGNNSGRTPPGNTERFLRQSVSVQYQGAATNDVQMIFANRLDLMQDSLGNDSSVNSFQEAYLRRRVDENSNLEVGRINLKHGVGIGYNPTDYFRTGAIRSFTSSIPSALRASRLGVFMGGGQWVGKDESLSAYLAPKLASKSSNADFSLDAGATNNRNRWLLVGSRKLAEDFEPQFLLYKEDGLSPQFGVNTTWLAGDSVVFYLEASRGQKQSKLDSVLGNKSGHGLQTQMATGFTYTTSTKLSLTVEYDYASDSLSSQDVSRLLASDYRTQQIYIDKVSISQELPARESVFLFANWKDAGWTNFEISMMVKNERVTYSRQAWWEVKYHWNRTDIALQYLNNAGKLNSIYGAAQIKNSWQLILSHYF